MAAATRASTIVALANNTCENDVRIIRSAEAAAAAGHRVFILARGRADLPVEDEVNGVTYLRFDPLPSKIGLSTIVAATRSIGGIRGGFGQTALAMRANATRYTSAGRRLAPDIVHAHDLYTLLAGWRIAQTTGARLIYDSHELEIGRNAYFSAVEKWSRAHLERFLIRRTDAVITVSDSIADFLAGRYAIPRPTVVLNTPKSSSAGSPSATDVRSHLGLAPEEKLAVYIGSVTFNRGLEILVEAMPHVPGLHVALVGPRNHLPTEQALRERVAAAGVEDRFHFVDPVPPSEVTAFVRSADVSMVLIQDACLSYRLSFPNKLLESVFAGVPVVASRLPEFEKLIARTSAGVTVDQADPEAIAAGIRAVLADRRGYLPTDAVIHEIEQEYGWSTQAERLLQLYARVGPARDEDLTLRAAISSP